MANRMELVSWLSIYEAYSMHLKLNDELKQTFENSLPRSNLELDISLICGFFCYNNDCVEIIELK